MSAFSRQNIIRVIAGCLVLGIIRVVLFPGSSSISAIVTTPSNSTYKFHLIDASHHSTSSSLSLTSLDADWASGSAPTHILPHPLLDDTFLVTNEVLKGEVWAVRLNRKERVVERVHSASTSGSDPCWCSTIDQHLICTNYASGNVVLFRVSPDSIDLKFDYTIATTDAKSHPHQVILHPHLKDIIYVPDLGLNLVHVLRVAGDGASARLESVQQWEAEELGLGPRHGVVSSEGDVLFLNFQTSSSAVRLSLNVDGTISGPSSSAHSTLTQAHQRLDPAYTQINFALSDLRISPREKTMYVLNRRVGGSFDASSGDSLAVFSDLDAGLAPPKHVSLGCWQPREMVLVDEGAPRMSSTQALVSCVGAGGKGAGLVLLSLREDNVKITSTYSGMSAMGIVVL